MMDVLQSVFGLLALTVIAWAFSEDRAQKPLKAAAAGIGLQIVLALMLLKIPLFKDIFLLLGDGEEREALEARASELGISGSLTFLGERKNVAEWMSLMEVLVVPSLNEGMGRVIVEAGLMKKAVVATRVGGIPDLIQDGKTGLLIDPRNSETIAHAVACLLEDPELVSKMGQDLRQRVVSGFTESRMIDRIDHLCREYLEKKGLVRLSSSQGLEMEFAQK